MTTIDNPIISPRHAKRFIESRIREIVGRLEPAADMADAASELLNSAAFQEATRRIMQGMANDFFGSNLNEGPRRNRAYAMVKMHQLYLTELSRMIDEPKDLAADLASLQEHYAELDALL